MSNKDLLEMLGENPGILKDIVRQTPDMCLAAVRKNGVALIYVRNQTPEICVEAVKTTPAAMRYVRDQTPDVILACAVARPESLVFVREEISESLKLDILERNGLALEYMPEQSEEMCRVAVENNPEAASFVDDMVWNGPAPGMKM